MMGNLTHSDTLPGSKISPNFAIIRKSHKKYKKKFGV